MDRLNRILILFFTILAFSLGGVIHLIQTEKFASIVTKRIKKKAFKDFGIELNFKRIEVKLFPPATILRDVKVERIKKNLAVTIYSEEIGLYFSIFDFFSRRFQVDTVSLNSTEIDLNFPDTNESDFKYTETFKKYEDFYGKSNVLIKNLNFKSLDLTINEDMIEVEKLDLSFFKSIIQVGGILNKGQSKYFPKSINEAEVDSVDFLFNFGEKNADVRQLSLSSGLDFVNVEGSLELKGSDPIVNLTAELNGGIRSIAKKVGYGDEVDEYPVDGVMGHNLFIKGPLSSPSLKLESELELIDSEYAQVDKIEFDIVKEGEDLVLNSLVAYQNNSTVKLRSPVRLFNIKNKKVLSKQAIFDADKVRTSDALYVLRDYLDVLKGELTGGVKIGWNKAGIYFLPEKGFKLNDLKVFSPDFGTKILENRGFSIIRANLLLTYDLVFKFKAAIQIGESKVQGEGTFSDNDMKVVVYESDVDLADIGPIVELPITGKGKLKGFVGGNYDNIVFTFLPELNDFEILNFNLGTIKGKVDFYIENMFLKVTDTVASYGGTQYEGGADFYFDKDFFTLDIKVNRGTYSDAERMIPEIIGLAFKEPLDLDFNFSGQINYKSSFDIENLYIKTNINGENVNVFSERLDSFSADVLIEKDILNLRRLSIKKNQGQAQAKGSLNILNSKFSYNGSLAGVGLKDFDGYNTLNLGLNGKVRGEFYGKGILDDFTSRAQFRLEKSEIGNRPIGDSIFTIYNKGSDIFLSSNLFEGVSISEGYISLDKKLKRKSYLNTRLYSIDPSLLAGVLSEHNFTRKSLTGSVDLYSELSFHIDDFEKFDLDFKIRELELGFLGETITVDKNKNKLFVKKGKLEDWAVRIETSKEGYFESTGEGDVSRSFQVNTKYKVNPVFLRLISPKLLSAIGEVSGYSSLIREKGEFSFHSESLGKDIDLKIDKVPGALRNISFKLISEGNDILLEKLTGQYGKGTISADGNIKLKFPFPEVNLNGAINGAQVPVTDKTFVVVSGNGNLKGSTLPYLLSGGLSVLHGEVLNEFEDFSKMIGLSEGYLRYVPNSGKLSKLNLVEYDLDFDIFNPVQVKNSISSLQLDGSLKIRGAMLKPLISGDLNILPNVSRVFFKGNEFIMTEGRLSFLDINKREVPEIKLAGVASVDRYEVGLDVEGRVDKFGIKLSSTPSLDQGQILSLLVLGVPDDVNQELDDSEREQIAVQGGVGLIVERFKLVKPIDSMLGLKFSVSPEFQEDDSSLLEGRLNSGESGTSRYKSGTKIKVQKKILKKVDVSFSSTVGGTVEETKEMNVNYNINKSLSLEGVYELRSIEEETEENPESVGADLKWKFSF